MNNKYFFNLNKYALSDYARELEEGELLPGRRILQENTKERFKKLSDRGVSNLNELAEILKSKGKIDQLAEESGIPAEFLKILKRELNRLFPKPVYLKDFPGIPVSVIARLEKHGIKNTFQLFEQADTIEKRNKLSKEADVSHAFIDELFKLSDLSRIWGVGAVFCRIFYKAGFDSVGKVAEAEASELYEALIETNRNGNYTKARFTVKDVASCIEFARRLPIIIK